LGVNPVRIAQGRDRRKEEREGKREGAREGRVFLGDIPPQILSSRTGCGLKGLGFVSD